MSFLSQLTKGLPTTPENLPPPLPKLDSAIPHAPPRKCPLTTSEKYIAVKNALRYFHPSLHPILSPEFAKELEIHGHIYMYRFIPKFQIKAYPISSYPCKITEAKAIMLMVFNNLDVAVAQYPHELVTYGGNGQVFSNWAQFWIFMKYLTEITDSQTLSMYSGHPLGLFPSSTSSPRVIITNGMVIPNYSSQQDYDRMFALNVSMYGQMTAGSYCYIGPQGIVHGTTITLLNAGRKYLNAPNLTGKVFVSSGLGGMSGAQAKASIIAGCIGIIAEVNLKALTKRHAQGWVVEIISDLDKLVKRIREAKKKSEVISIGYHGNVVDLWERLSLEYERTGDLLVDLGSDQTSLHNPNGGGYIPVGVTEEEAKLLIVKNEKGFKELLQKSLNRHVEAIGKLVEGGMKFWDYGNAFLLEASRAGAKVKKQDGGNEFIYPSYVEDIMGDIFSLGFGPFRWVCCSGLSSDLEKTDKAAAEVITSLLETETDPDVCSLYSENLKWIKEAGKHALVVGSQARILYSDYIGRCRLARKFNELIKNGEVTEVIVISRDHHDVSGADSPYRETSDVYDGSRFCADMAVQNFIGGGIRGATWVALHNGGGVGWGEAINGGFGLVLNGKNTDVAENLLLWDVNNGVARRAWGGNRNALKAIKRLMGENKTVTVTLPQWSLDD